MKKEDGRPMEEPSVTEEATDIENREHESKENAESAPEAGKAAAPSKPRFHIGQLFYNNYFLVVFSAFCAFVLWIFISSSNSSEEVTRVVSDVPLAYSMSQSVKDLGLQVIDTQDKVVTVNVTITGKSYIVGQVTKDDLTAAVRLSDVTSAGTYRAEVKAQATGKLNGFSIDAIDPAFISVRLDRTISKEYTLVTKTNVYEAGEGYTLLQPRLAEETIKITGPTTDLEEIASVAAIAEIPAVVTETSTYPAKIVLYDSEGNEIDNPALQLDFGETEMTIVVMQVKELPIEVSRINEPADGENIKITLSLPKVRVSGASDIFATLDSLNVGTIDFTRVNTDNTEFTFDLEAVLPTGCSLEDDVTTVTATVDLTGMRTREFDVSNLQLTGQSGSDAKVNVLTKTIRLMITGPAEQIEEITADNITVLIDTKDVDQASGKHEIPVTVKIDGGDRCWVYGSPTVFVQVS